MARGFDSIPDRGGRDNLRETDIFDIFSLSAKAKNNWVSLRFLPIDLLPVKKHWIKIMGGKDKDKEVTIPRMCVSFDPDNEGTPLAGRSCPYCKLEHGGDDTGAPARFDVKYLSQAIVRDIQRSAPRKLPKLTAKEKKTGKKERDSESWTPVRVIPLTPGVARRIRELGDRNFTDKKKTKTAPVNHEKYGIDIDIRYNPKAAGAEKYSVDKGERTPLEEEELEYLTWDVDNWEEIYDLLGRLDSKDALKDFQKLDVVGGTSLSDDDEEEEEDDDLSLGRSKKSKKSKKKTLLDDDDEEEEEDDDLPVRKKKSKLGAKKKLGTKKKKSKVDDDEDEDDDKPVKKKKTGLKKTGLKKKTSLKKKSKSDDDDDEPKKKKKVVKKKLGLKKKK